MNKPKIISPGGSYNKALVAAYYGADEVYVGVPFTSLRMRQNKVRDFDLLKKTIDWIHGFGSKALLTMNIFPKNSDIKIFEMVMDKIKSVGADAIIFSDLWTYTTVRKYLPDMPLHLSTQTTTLNYASVQFWKDLWVKRIVCARELHIDDIKEIKKQIPDVELEVFVHGAMCMTYSGRCLLGDYMSGRDANKWECSHNCRYKYKVWLEEEKRPWQFFQLKNDWDWSYIMSSKDLCVIQRLEEILPYVDALKIEWRSKSEFYVGALTKAYKHVRDSIVNWTPINPEIQNLVEKIPHRQYRDGFLLNKLSAYPDGEPEVLSITQNTWWPLFSRKYIWVFTPETFTKWDRTYHKFVSKEVLEAWMIFNYITPENMWNLEILDILDKNWNQLTKATCNTGEIFVLTNKTLSGWELLYND